MLFDERIRPEYPRKISQESVRNHKRNPRMAPNPRSGRRMHALSTTTHDISKTYGHLSKTYVRIHDKCELYSFTELKCEIYETPENGAMIIRYFGPDPLVQVQCKSGYDFVRTPPLMYICVSGKWSLIDALGIADKSVPWPKCASKHFKN